LRVVDGEVKDLALGIVNISLSVLSEWTLHSYLFCISCICIINEIPLHDNQS